MSELDELGAEHRRLLAALAELEPRLHAAIRAERARGAKQADLVQRSGYRTIQTIRTITGEAPKVSRAKKPPTT